MTSTVEQNMPDEAAAPAVRSQRFLWLDNLRGFALICMASYHFTWDLAAFGYLEPDFPAVGWPKIYARTIASTFLFLAGFSLVLAHGNGIKWASFWKRFGWVAGAAVAIVSAITFAGSVIFNIHEALIYFGILHEIALASLIGLLFLRVPWPVIVVAGAVFVIVANNAYLLEHLQFEFFDAPWFWWLGLSAHPRASFDFVPIFPWLGPFLFGMAAARIGPLMNLLRQNSVGINSARLSKTPLAFLGRHSLIFYLVHQPTLIAGLYLFSLVVPAPVVTPEVKYLRDECQPSCVAERDANFCSKFCSCTLKGLQHSKLLAPYQSGAISTDDYERLKDIASECTRLSE